jgi:hypothetical protein
MFLLGPHLILGVREYHARLVADSDEGTGMASIVFQERIQTTTGSGVVREMLSALCSHSPGSQSDIVKLLRQDMYVLVDLRSDVLSQNLFI